MSAVDAKTISVYMQVTGPFAGQMARNGAAVQTFGTQANAGMTRAATGMAKFSAVANKVGMVSAVAIAAGMALSAKAAIAFESSFAGVRKTVETSEAGFRKLADGVREMATEIPIGVNELNRIMELGGQLGVGPENLLEFTDVIAKIGVTTTLATDEAAMGFARLDNVMQLNGDSFDEMGATIVDLGNNFAATENEILTFATRIAPVGATVGMTTDEVLALATAFTSVGVPAERGGTAIQKTFIKMADAAESGGASLDSFAKTAGMTSAEFSKLFKQDSAAAFTAFVEGLNSVEEAGGNVFTVLDSVGLGNQRVISSLLAMANAGDTLSDALRLGESAWRDNVALTDEANKRFETTASQLAIVKNKITDLGISIGAGLLPWIGDLAEGFSLIIDFVENMDPAFKSAALAVAGFTTALWLASAHPIILGLAAVAGAIAYMGHQSAIAKKRVETLKEVLAAGMATDMNLDEIFGENVIADWLKLGFSRDEISKALTGTEKDFQDWAVKAQNAIRSTRDENAGLSVGPGLADIQLMEAYRDELHGIAAEENAIAAARNRAKILGIDLPGFDRERESADKARDAVQSLYHARQGIIDQGVSGIRPATIQADELADISEALDDYSTSVNDAFTDVDKAMRDQIDLWYEFDDDLEVAWTDIIDTLHRQITSVGTFESVLARLDLRSDVEAFVRRSFNTPALMEAFNQFYAEGGAEFSTFIDGIIKEQDRLSGVIQDKWSRMVEDVEFTSGQQLLADIESIANTILADPNNIYNPAEVWLGLIEATMAEADNRGIADDVSGWLLNAFSDDGSLRGSVDVTKAMIDELILKLQELAGDYDVNVNTTFKTIGTPPGLPGDADNFKYPDASIGVVPERKALGGNVFGRTPYLVGELGPELFIPSRSGTIVPNNKLNNMPSNNIYLTFNVERGTAVSDIQTALVVSGVADMVDLGKAGM